MSIKEEAMIENNWSRLKNKLSSDGNDARTPSKKRKLHAIERLQAI